MDDIFLYNHIKQAIKQRKQLPKDTTEQNFAESYCRRQLMKKKLNINSSNSNAKNKMKSLMKNFAHVETYVDLNELLYSINVIRTKERAEKKMAELEEKHRQSKILRLQDIEKLNNARLSQFSSEEYTQAIDPIEILKDRFRSEINQRIKRMFHVENSEMEEMVQFLEKETHLNDPQLKNNSANYLCYLNQVLQKIQKNQDLQGDAVPENERIFRHLTHSLSNLQIQKEPKRQYFRSTNLNSKQKKQENELLHKISTFLQIALENEHKEKWATKDMKKFRSTHGSFRFKKGKNEKSKFFLKGIELQSNEDKEKQMFQSIHENNISPTASRRSSAWRSSHLLRKIKSEQRSIFRKKSVERGKTLNPIHQLKKSTQWNPINVNRKEPNKDSIFFKTWNSNVFEQRKTAPVNHENLFEDFTKTNKYDFTAKENQKNVNFRKQETLSTEKKSKNESTFQKKRQSKQFNFIKLPRGANYKTVVINSKKQTEVEQKLNVSYNEEIFKEIQNIPSVARTQALHTPPHPQSTKLKTFVTDPSMRNTHTPVQKKSISTKSNALSQAFTFKKRGKKQQIIKKLQSFIEEINNQEKMSKMQNEYYDSAINHLHDLSKTTYNNYQPEALAGQEEISELKKFVNGINPSLLKNRSKRVMR